MDEQTPGTKKLQWKWVGITLALYLVFYLLPIAATAHVFRSDTGSLIIGVWLFGGIIIVAAVAAFLSEEITIIEPAIASAMMIIFWILIFSIFIPGNKFDIKRDTLPVLGIISVVFVLSLVGAALGERAQKLWKPKNPQ